VEEVRRGSRKAEHRKNREEKAKTGQREKTDIPRFFDGHSEMKETRKVEMSQKGKEAERQNTRSA
jgi:hypothetical protein